MIEPFLQQCQSGILRFLIKASHSGVTDGRCIGILTIVNAFSSMRSAGRLR